MTTESDIRQALAAMRYHHRLKSSDPGYAGSTFESDTIEGIATLKNLMDRMRDSNRSDFLGEEI
ncbi:hypothetical protein [Salmonella phage SSBI34]|nr:hypothetical protein [Salmonella phage SSBI34]